MQRTDWCTWAYIQYNIKTELDSAVRANSLVISLKGSRQPYYGVRQQKWIWSWHDHIPWRYLTVVLSYGVEKAYFLPSFLAEETKSQYQIQKEVWGCCTRLLNLLLFPRLVRKENCIKLIIDEYVSKKEEKAVFISEHGKAIWSYTSLPKHWVGTDGKKLSFN